MYVSGTSSLTVFTSTTTPGSLPVELQPELRRDRGIKKLIHSRVCISQCLLFLFTFEDRCADRHKAIDQRSYPPVIHGSSFLRPRQCFIQCFVRVKQKVTLLLERSGFRRSLNHPRPVVLDGDEEACNHK